MDPKELQKFEDLKKRHRELDRQVAQLASRLYLTPQEEQELANLKREKLRLKDELYELANKLGLEYP